MSAGSWESRRWETFRSVKGWLRCNPYEREKEEAGLGKGSGQGVDLTKSLSAPQGALELVSRGLWRAQTVRTFSHSPAQSWARPTPRTLVAELKSWEKSERVNSGGCQLDTLLTAGPWAPSSRGNVSNTTLQLAHHSSIQKQKVSSKGHEEKDQTGCLSCGHRLYKNLISFLFGSCCRPSQRALFLCSWKLTFLQGPAQEFSSFDSPGTHPSHPLQAPRTLRALLPQQSATYWSILMSKCNSQRVKKYNRRVMHMQTPHYYPSNPHLEYFHHAAMQISTPIPLPKHWCFSLQRNSFLQNIRFHFLICSSYCDCSPNNPMSYLSHWHELIESMSKPTFSLFKPWYHTWCWTCSLFFRFNRYPPKIQWRNQGSERWCPCQWLEEILRSNTLVLNLFLCSYCLSQTLLTYLAVATMSVICRTPCPVSLQGRGNGYHVSILITIFARPYSWC